MIVYTLYMPPYELLAKYYHHNWESFSRGYMGFIRHHIDVYPDVPVVDLGCGTGHLSFALSKMGCNVCAVDNSRMMLKVARERFGENQNLRFVQGDMRDINFGFAPRLVIIAYDAINYLPDESSVLCCLQNIYRQLSLPGTLVFDINTPEIYHRYHRAEEIFSIPQGTIRQRTRYRPWIKQGITEFIFQLAGGQESEIHIQKVYRISKIKRLLRKAGFAGITAYDDFDGAPAHVHSQKPVFIAHVA